MAEESYAGVTIHTPDGWKLRQMKTFSGSVPSRAWVFEKNQSEILISSIRTEGILDGMTNQSDTTLIRLYTEDFVTGWGGRADKEATQVFDSAPFCDGNAGVIVKATFGNDNYIYYGCLKHSQDWSGFCTAVTWINLSNPSFSKKKETEVRYDAGTILSAFLQNIQIASLIKK